MNAAGIIFSNLNNNTLSRLTEDRTVAAIPFACRYRLIDFSLSNMVNAGISNINVVTNYNYRSLVEHIGSGKDWDLARRSGGINVISPYQTAHSPNAMLYTSRLEALLSMENGYIKNMKEDYVILLDCDFVCNIDLSDVVRAHNEKEADITIVTVRIATDFTKKTQMLLVKSENDGRIIDFKLGNRYDQEHPEMSANIFVMKTDYLRALVYEAKQNNGNSLTRDVFMKQVESRRFYSYCYSGYFACVSSYRDYFSYSIALTEDPTLRHSLLGLSERPIFTNVHNSAPTVYKEGASVKNSMIADGCVIEGTVENSVIFRGVRIKKGAVVKNSVLFSGTNVGEETTLHCVIADKDVTVSDGITLSGHKTIPFFIRKGQKV